MIEIKIIDRAHKQDINIKNEPFDLWGYMRPSFVNGEWSYTVQKLPAEVVGEQCFPDENYDYEEMAENSIFVGAYDVVVLPSTKRDFLSICISTI